MIRLAKEADISDLERLLLQVGAVHHEIRPDIFPRGCLKYDEEALTALLKDENAPVFVAQEAGAVVGYCFCVLKQCPQSPVSVGRRELYIDDLCVDEGHRGRGVATALYHHVLDYAKSLGCQFVTLNVWNGNDSAMKFYEKMHMTPRNITMEMKL